MVKRIFTGAPSGDALYDIGLALQPTATHRGDGLELYGVRITVPVHCAPSGNRPTTGERNTCRPGLARELEFLCRRGGPSAGSGAPPPGGEARVEEGSSALCGL